MNKTLCTLMLALLILPVANAGGPHVNVEVRPLNVVYDIIEDNVGRPDPQELIDETDPCWPVVFSYYPDHIPDDLDSVWDMLEDTKNFPVGAGIDWFCTLEQTPEMILDIVTGLLP